MGIFNLFNKKEREFDNITMTISSSGIESEKPTQVQEIESLKIRISKLERLLKLSTETKVNYACAKMYAQGYLPPGQFTHIDIITFPDGSRRLLEKLPAQSAQIIVTEEKPARVKAKRAKA